MANEAKEIAWFLIPEDSSKGLEIESQWGQSNRYRRSVETHDVRGILWTERQVPEFIMKDRFE